MNASHQIVFKDMRSGRFIDHEPLGVSHTDIEMARQEAKVAALAFSLANGFRVRGVVQETRQ